MASRFESDFWNWPFLLHQGPDRKDIPYMPSAYYMQPGGVGDPALSCTSYYPQNFLLNSLQHVQNDYNCLMDGVFSDVLIQDDEEPAFTPPPLSYSPPSHPPSSDDLMWGSDLSFGPDGFRPSPNSSPQPQSDGEPVYPYAQSIKPLPHGVPTTQSLPETSILEMPPLEKQKQQKQQPPELLELSRRGIQKTTGKKRRRLLHIIAERNRRLSQNKMYEELYRMVPGLDGSARSTKREVLTRTANFLEDLVEGNKDLQAQLRQLSSHPGHGHGAPIHSGWV
ncbi:hypothetical protein BDW59DRAFT_175959 [Aspergillus cavernicola]|uniref:BHLH domain-containing protein n=1 Tax=Aspergillus cavernicola TaxID=176166 RepID=A0ABR4HKM6_9EURO